MTRFSLIFLTLALSFTAAPAQTTSDTPEVDSSNVYEHLTRVLDEHGSTGAATTRAAEHLIHLTQNPLDVNHSSAAELRAIPSLSPSLARRIVQYRRDHGPYASLQELTRVRGIGSPKLAILRPYLHVSPSIGPAEDDGSPFPSAPPVDTMLNNLDLRILQRMTRDLDPGRGFETDTSRTTFEGSPLRLSTRLHLGYENNVHFALTLDKDPGEPLRWDPQTNTYTFDHIAGNLTLRNMGRLRTLTIGNYTAQYGQGVALWDGLSFGKGREPVSPLVRSGRGILPFQSTTESQYFRGTAATVALTPELYISGFVSRRHRDARLDSSHAEAQSPDGPLPIQTISVGGLHRTPSEIERKGTFGTHTVGGALEYDNPALSAGIVGYKSRFDRPIHPSDQPYRRFSVSGTQTSMISAFASAVVDHYTLFGEVARAPTGRYGALAGATLEHEAGVEAVLLGRRFPPAFPGLYNSAVGESGATQNETGIYVGLRLQLAERWSLGAYADQYRFPWLRFGVPRPSGGFDTRVILEYDPRPWLSSYLQLRTEHEEDGTERIGPANRLLSAVGAERRHSARWHTEYEFSDALTLRTRLQLSRFVRVQDSPSYGVLLYQGLRFKAGNRLQFDARLAFFDTDGFDARIYAYEHDLLYSFSVPVLFDRGQRSYVVARYSPTSSITMEAKYGVTWYPQRRVVGSGLTATNTNHVRDLRVQVRWRF